MEDVAWPSLSVSSGLRSLDCRSKRKFGECQADTVEKDLARIC